MFAQNVISHLTKCATALAKRHGLDPGKPSTGFSEYVSISPVATLEEYEGWATAAGHLAARHIYDLETVMNVLLDSGSDAERRIARDAHACVFSSFWHLLVHREDPVKNNEPFPADLVVPHDFATGRPRERRHYLDESDPEMLCLDTAEPTPPTPWLQVVEDCLDLIKKALECLDAQQRILFEIDLPERWPVQGEGT